MTPRLLTSRYASHRAEHGIAVATSVGRPKWPLDYELDHELRDLAPYGLLHRNLPWDQFEAGYRARLDRVGPDRLRAQFDAIQHGGRPLVLLCFEDVHAGQPCHRRIAAAWLEEHGFGPVPEVEESGRPDQQARTWPQITHPPRLSGPLADQLSFDDQEHR